MASGQQKLEDQQVIQLEKQMSEKYDGIRKRVHNLQGVIDALEGKWKGIGKSAFDKKQYEINESLQNIGKILADVIDAMNKTRNIKDSSEDDVRSSVSKISVTDGASSLSKY
ncbi:WXG100 family type VII secretion target [Streptomyces sp. NPDC006552]|uniref:WXG100 family type VII secretion target n=1 Tax=Streptomyces sp. NPDC006552 TaxID=3157179 RepID=UPI0033AC0BAF